MNKQQLVRLRKQLKEHRKGMLELYYISFCAEDGIINRIDVAKGERQLKGYYRGDKEFKQWNNNLMLKGDVKAVIEKEKDVFCMISGGKTVIFAEESGLVD